MGATVLCRNGCRYKGEANADEYESDLESQRVQGLTLRCEGVITLHQKQCGSALGLKARGRHRWGGSLRICTRIRNYSCISTRNEVEGTAGWF